MRIMYDAGFVEEVSIIEFTKVGDGSGKTVGVFLETVSCFDCSECIPIGEFDLNTITVEEAEEEAKRVIRQIFTTGCLDIKEVKNFKLY